MRRQAVGTSNLADLVHNTAHFIPAVTTTDVNISDVLGRLTVFRKDRAFSAPMHNAINFSDLS